MGFAYIIWKQNRSSAVNLINAPPAKLKEVFMGEDPYIYYCASGAGDMNAPRALLDAHKALGSAYGLAALNCSQTLPSGRNIWTKYHLNRKLKPTVFVQAPWTAAQQINPNHMRDGITLSKQIRSVLEPHPDEVRTNHDLQTKCGSNNDGRTCIAILKGHRYTSSHHDIVKRIVMTYHKARVVVIDASKKRLSIENPELLPENFTMKVYVLKSNYYQAMSTSPTLPHVQSFLSDAMQAPLTSFAGNGTMKLIKAFSNADEDGTGTDENSDLSRKQDDASEVEAELRRREAMERQKLDYLFDFSVEDDSEEDSAENEDDEIFIEL